MINFTEMKSTWISECQFRRSKCNTSSKSQGNKVQAKIKVKQKGLMHTHCIAHHTEHAVLDSITSDPYLEDFDDGIDFYSRTQWRDLHDQVEIRQDQFKQLGKLKIVNG